MRLPAALAALLVAEPAFAQSFVIDGSAGTRLDALPVAEFNEPWAMTYLPDGSMLVTEKRGSIQLVAGDGSKTQVAGVPKVSYGGQGGLGDIVAHPDFATNSLVYVSYAEAGNGGKGAAVARGTLVRSDGSARLENVEVIWRQVPKVSGSGHFSHRIAFAPDGKLFITSGDRQKFNPSQDLGMNLGKVMRLNDDGTTPPDNPWQDQGDLAKTFWSVGHRNVLGIAFDADGRLWTNEMGPRHGDELNLTIAGENYGWPVVSNGNHYSGKNIPDHDTRPELKAPAAFWVPTIAPSSLVVYSGDAFGDWKGDALIGALAGEALVRVDIDGETATEAERFGWGSRVREVEQAPDGAIMVLEDGPGGRMLRLTPAD